MEDLSPAEILSIYSTAIKQMSAKKSLILENEYLINAISIHGFTEKEVSLKCNEILQTNSHSFTADELEALMCFSTIHDLENHAEILHELLLLTHHYMHEDIISTLQKLANPKSIPFIQKAIFLKNDLRYLDYDDYGSYYKKCFWALYAMKTKEAVSVIEEFVDSKEVTIRDEAIYRIYEIKNDPNYYKQSI